MTAVHRPRRAAASLLAAAVLGASTLVATVVAPASPAAAADPAAISVSKTVDISRDGEDLIVNGTGFDATGNTGTRPPLAGQPGGVYVIFGKFDANWKPSAGAPSSSRRVVNQVWALPEPSHSVMDPDGSNPEIILMNPDGSFTATVEAKTDPRPGIYGIYTYPGSGATNAANETATPVRFTPAITVSKTDGVAPGGENLTITGDGFNATGNTGTRPPLAGQPGGVYVIFGKFDANWKPSAGAPSSSRRVIQQVWALPEPSHSVMDPDGSNPEIILMNPDGSFTATVNAHLDPRAGNYGVYTYPGSGATNAANELEQPVTFAPGIRVSKTEGVAPGGETLTVLGTGFDATGNTGTRPPLAGQPGGAYVIFGKFDANWKPSAGAPGSSRRVVNQVWALPEPSHSVMDPDGSNPEIILMNPDGSFTATVNAHLDARAGNYGVYTYPGSGATNAANEFEQAVSFAPGIRVSKTTNIARDGETLTVLGTGFDPEGDLGTHPPLPGLPGGAFVIFGKFDEVWQPSAGAPSSVRRVVNRTWALPEASRAIVDPEGTNPEAQLMNPDGTFNVTIDAELDPRDGRYGIFVYPGSGAVNAAHEFEQLVSFKTDLPAAPTIGDVTVAEGRATVSWTAPADDGGAEVTGYVVTPVVDGTPGTPVEVAAPATSVTIDGLANGTAVSFTVAAVNSVGTGAASEASAAVTPQWWLPWSTGNVAITELFTWLTGKAPTTAQRNQWKADLDAGTKLPGDLVAALRVGTDATANVDPTTRLYSAYLTRVPDASGLNFWIKRRRSGNYTLIRISSFFADSNEFKTRYGSLTNKAFVELIYQNVLRRQPDASGLAYWTKRLDDRKISRGQLMISFSESNEFKNKEANRVTAAVLYIHLLGKTPTTAQRDALVDRLVAGDTVAQIVRDLIGEASFDTRAG